MIELARNCLRTEAVIRYSKEDAAQHQLEAAIANLFLGNWPAAITLAGAAEDILPSQEPKTDFFSFVKGKAAKDHGRSEKEIGDMLNELRNWLKHENQGHKLSQDITQADAVIMILRAHSRLYHHHAPFRDDEILSENLEIFVSWFRTNYPDWLEAKKEVEKHQ